MKCTKLRIFDAHGVFGCIVRATGKSSVAAQKMSSAANSVIIEMTVATKSNKQIHTVILTF